MKDRIFDSEGRISDFEFDENVARVFDDMVARSVPYYDEIQRLQADLAVEFLPERESLVIDLGCSTGTTIHLLASHPRCPGPTRFLGIDNSPAMLAEARAKLDAAAPRVELLEADLNAGVTLRPCRVAFLNWTLQFVRPLYREALEKARAGKYVSEFVWAGPDFGDLNGERSVVGFLPGPALGERKAQLDELVKALAGGLDLFKGPLQFQDGTEFLKAGESAAPQQIWYLPQLVAGITGPSK